MTVLGAGRLLRCLVKSPTVSPQISLISRKSRSDCSEMEIPAPFDARTSEGFVKRKSFGFDYARIMKADADAQMSLIDEIAGALLRAMQRFDSCKVRPGSQLPFLPNNIAQKSAFVFDRSDLHFC